MFQSTLKTSITTFALLLVSFYCAALLFSEDQVADPRPTLEEIQKNRFEFLQNKWKSYFLEWATLSCSYSAKTYCDGRPTGSNQNEYTVAYPSLAIQSIEDNNGPQLVLCESEKYKFRLTKENGEEEAWQIQSLKKDSQAAALDAWESFSTPKEAMSEDKLVGHIILQTLGGGLYGGVGQTLPSIFRLENLNVEQIEWGERNGQEALHIVFNYRPEPDEQTREAMEKDPDWSPYQLSGEVWLDSTFYLILDGSLQEIVGYETRNYTVASQYKLGANGAPVPVKTMKSSRQSRTDSSDLGKVYSGEITFNDDFHVASEKEKERFDLSYYELPEPKKAPSFKALQSLLLILGVGVVLYAAVRHIRNKSQRLREA